MDFVSGFCLFLTRVEISLLLFIICMKQFVYNKGFPGKCRQGCICILLQVTED